LAAFSSYVLALAKNSYKTCACLTLMKLTAGHPPFPSTGYRLGQPMLGTARCSTLFREPLNPFTWYKR